MARSYGALKVAVWEPGNDFRRLTPIAQWAYAMLLSQPQLSNLGLLPYTPEKWARFAAGLTLEQLERAIAELEEHDFVIVDRGVGELLVRTFIKHDQVWKQPKLITNARRIIREVESAAIHTYLTMRHPWLLDERPKADIETYEASPDTPIETPSDTPIGDTPSDRGKRTPSDTHIPTRARAGPGSGPGVGAAAEVQEQLPRPPAAADLEAPRPATIKAAAERYAADLRVLEPEAQHLPAPLFDDVVERVAIRCTTGPVTNPAGLLIDLARRARREADKRAAHNQPATTIDDEILFDAASYARGQHPWDVAAELITRKLTRLGINGDHQVDLLEQAADTYRAEARQPAPSR